jgi:hypothetical protein
LGSGKSRPPSGQLSRQGWLQKSRHGFPHFDLQMGPGFPGFQVGLGNKMAAIGSVDDDVVVLVPVGLDSLGGV